MKLIIDSGGTKANWSCLVGRQLEASGTVPGIHPFFLSEAELAEKLQEIRRVLPHSIRITEIFHYGTGTNSEANLARLRHAYHSVFPKAKTTVDSDLLAVAHALCGHRSGIAAILGTGSNIGLYNGKVLVKTAGGLGYVLGDEGGGAYLGRHLLNHFLNGLLPANLQEQLRDQYELTRDNIVEAVYRKPFPNRYLASFAPFLGTHRDHPYLAALIRACFRDFFRMNVLPLQPEKPLPLSCGGSIAFHFGDFLRAVAAEFRIPLGDIAMSPMEGLLKFHAAD